MKNIPKQVRDFAKANDRRVFRFDLTTEDGGEAEMVGSLRPEDCDRAFEIWREIMELMGKEND